MKLIRDTLSPQNRYITLSARDIAVRHHGDAHIVSGRRQGVVRVQTTQQNGLGGRAGPGEFPSAAPESYACRRLPPPARARARPVAPASRFGRKLLAAEATAFAAEGPPTPEEEAQEEAAAAEELAAAALAAAASDAACACEKRSPRASRSESSAAPFFRPPRAVVVAAWCSRRRSRKGRQ